jgi:cell wall-associated NlpC family hydrolase
MIYGISDLSLIPVREYPSDKSQMVNQLLFGDLIEIKEEQKGWALIKTVDDNYEGWIDEKQLKRISKNDLDTILENTNHFVYDHCVSLYDTNNRKITVTKGASIPGYQNHQFSIVDREYSIEGKVETFNKNATGKTVAATALQYLGSPYLWGGRSPFGIDCSGFTQIVFKMNGIKIPRDASQQVNLGHEIDFVEEAKEGDLAFFGDDESITHVGIVLDRHKIIHASGEVRIDTFDHQGVFNEEKKIYSHHLRVIKRIMDS